MDPRRDADLHDVVLTRVPAEREAVMAVVRLLRETFKVGNVEARHFIENLPRAIAEDLPGKEAQSLRDAFQRAGATVEIRPAGGNRGRRPPVAPK
jgi:ribosomal protein L7/L12